MVSKKFTDLICWRQGHELVLMIYEITKLFPKEETYGLCDQMRRCSVSITSNIAEGFSRGTPKDKIHFYFISKGSISELQNQLIIAKDLKYISDEAFNTIGNKTVSVHKLLNSFIKSIKRNAET